jgi:hypothetical protein
MKWNDELIKEHLLESIKILGIDRMPTANELKGISRNDLHCKISRTKKYSGWADDLGLALKRSDTVVGQEWEKDIANFIRVPGVSVELMTTKHPYDILFDGSVKIDVKAANPYLLRGSRVHTFNLSKENPTCDIYVCLALDEEGNKERTFVIPSHHVSMKMLNVGKESKYNKYIGRWDYLKKYVDFYRSIM